MALSLSVDSATVGATVSVAGVMRDCALDLSVKFDKSLDGRP